MSEPKIDYMGTPSANYNDTLLENLDEFANQAGIKDSGKRMLAKESARAFIENMQKSGKTASAKSIIDSMKAGM